MIFIPEDGVHKRDIWPIRMTIKQPDAVWMLWGDATGRPLQKKPHMDGGETSSRNDFNHRPRLSSQDNRILYNDDDESLCQLIYCNI